MDLYINQAPSEGYQCVPMVGYSLQAHSTIQDTRHALEADTLKRMKNKGSKYKRDNVTSTGTLQQKGIAPIDGGRRLKGGDRAE